jgi:hypothetical protein
MSISGKKWLNRVHRCAKFNDVRSTFAIGTVVHVTIDQTQAEWRTYATVHSCRRTEDPRLDVMRRFAYGREGVNLDVA